MITLKKLTFRDNQHFIGVHKLLLKDLCRIAIVRTLRHTDSMWKSNAHEDAVSKFTISSVNFSTSPCFFLSVQKNGKNIGRGPGPAAGPLGPGCNLRPLRARRLRCQTAPTLQPKMKSYARCQAAPSGC